MTEAAALSLAGVGKRFGALTAVDQVTLDVRPGERRALIGPNGAGKTTLFHVVSGVLPPSNGTISMFGHDVSGMSLHRRVALGMARTFQLTNLFNKLTVEQNIILSLQGLTPTKLAMFRPLASFRHLERDAIELLDHWGLEHRRFTPVHELSYGEQRTLEIILAVAQKPRLLLLDEPTAGLSPAETAAASRVIQSLSRDMAVLLIEHDMDVVLGLCDSITVLHLGQVVTTGAPAEVQANSRVQEIYMGVEAL